MIFCNFVCFFASWGTSIHKVLRGRCVGGDLKVAALTWPIKSNKKAINVAFFGWQVEECKRDVCLFSFFGRNQTQNVVLISCLCFLFLPCFLVCLLNNLIGRVDCVLEIVFCQIKLGGEEINQQAGYKKGPHRGTKGRSTTKLYTYIYFYSLYIFRVLLALVLSFLMTLRPLPFGATMRRWGIFLFKLLDPFQLNSPSFSCFTFFALVFCFVFLPFSIFTISCIPQFYFYFYYFCVLLGLVCVCIEEVFLIFCLLHFSQRFYRAIKIIKIKLKLDGEPRQRSGVENENGNVYEILRF